MLGAIPDPDDAASANETPAEHKRRLRRARDRRYRARQRALQNGEPVPIEATLRELATRRDAEWDDDAEDDGSDDDAQRGSFWEFCGAMALTVGVIAAVMLLPVRAAGR
jgi:hypothetical protein